jgi:hypothetical protein
VGIARALHGPCKLQQWGRAANICTTLAQSRLSRTSMTHEQAGVLSTENSTDWCVGRRLELKSVAFFFVVLRLVILIDVLNDVLNCFCARLRFAGDYVV